MRKVLLVLGVALLGLGLAQVRTLDQIRKSGEIRIGTEGAFPPSTTLTRRTNSRALRWTWAMPSPKGWG